MIGLHKELKYLANIKSLYIYSRKSNDPVTEAYYIYCKTLNKIIKEAKSSITIDM
jgi:hypothetical protein